MTTSFDLNTQALNRPSDPQISAASEEKMGAEKWTALMKLNPVMDIFIRHLTPNDVAAIKATDKAGREAMLLAVPANPFDYRKRAFTSLETFYEHPLLQAEMIECLNVDVSEDAVIGEAVALLERIQKVTLRVFQGTLSAEQGAQYLIKKELTQDPEFMERLIANLLSAPKNLEDGHPTGVEDLIKMIMMSPRISAVFFLAAKNGDEAALKMMMESEQFTAVAQEDFQDAFMVAGIHGHAACLQMMINSGRLGEIPLETFQDTFILAAKNGHADCLQLLIDSARFNEISRNTFSVALGLAFVAEHEDCVNIIRDLL